jgi:hypothetical protein
MLIRTDRRDATTAPQVEGDPEFYQLYPNRTSAWSFTENHSSNLKLFVNRDAIIPIAWSGRRNCRNVVLRTIKRYGWERRKRNSDRT